MNGQITQRVAKALFGACTVLGQIIPEIAPLEPIQWLRDHPEIIYDEGPSVKFRVRMWVRNQKTDIATVDVELWRHDTWNLVSAVSEYNNEKVAWRFFWDDSVERIR